MNERIEQAIDAVEAAEQQPATPLVQMVQLRLRTEPLLLALHQHARIVPPVEVANANVMLRHPDGTWQVVLIQPGATWLLQAENAPPPAPKIWTPGMQQ